MKQIVFLIEAEQDLNVAATYYESQEPSLGLEFIEEIDLTLKKILNTPERWPLVAENTRMILVKRFPFKIIYRFDPDEICILAIAHQKRKWDYWKIRKK
jgi:plasmid stabilization system protein ParE